MNEARAKFSMILPDTPCGVLPTPQNGRLDIADLFQFMGKYRALNPGEVSIPPAPTTSPDGVCFFLLRRRRR